MNINYLIELLTNRLSSLTLAKDQAFSAGDLERINTLDAEINGVKSTLEQLKLLVALDTAATSTNTTVAGVVKSGIEITKNSVQGPSAGAVINGYDISAYATDVLYEEKINKILANMPTFTVVGDIDIYIQNFAQESPVTGEMIYFAVQKYGVDLPLTVAIIQNDSNFGTMGVGARTFNPGNVGNTGLAEQMYPSWTAGVEAVADWLNRHRVLSPILETPDILNSTSTPPIIDATSTPPVLLPDTPIIPATSTTPFVVPTINATTTPITDLPVVSETSETPSAPTPTPTIIPIITPTSTPEIIPEDVTPTSTPLSVNFKSKGRKRFFSDKT